MGEDGGHQWIAHYVMFSVGYIVYYSMQTCIVPQIQVSFSHGLYHRVCVVYLGSLHLIVYFLLYAHLQWEVTFSFPRTHVSPRPHTILFVHDT